MTTPPQTPAAESVKPQDPGFVLASEPPTLDMAVDGTGQRPAYGTTTAGPVSVQAPASTGFETTPEASPALEQLAAATLDAAELANRGAQAAAAASADLRRAQEGLRLAQETAQKQALVLLVSTTLIMVICLTFFLVTGIRMNSRINQLDMTIDAVVKRVVELNNGVESLDAMKDSVGKLAAQVDAMTKTSDAVGAKLDAAVKQTESLTTQIPSKTAQQVASTAQGMSRQVDALGAKVQAQASAVQALSRDVQALKGSAANVDKLNRDVQALVTLQRERYLEAVQRQPAPTRPASSPAVTQPAPAPAQLPGTAPSARLAEREPTPGQIQYPRPQAATSPNAQPAPAVGVISVGPRPQP